MCASFSALADSCSPSESTLTAEEARSTSAAGSMVRGSASRIQLCAARSSDSTASNKFSLPIPMCPY